MLGEYNHTILQGFLVVALVYVLVNSALAAAAGRLERRTGQPRGAAARAARSRTAPAAER